MGISVTDSKLGELARMISGWPGLVSGSAQDLIDDSLVLLEHLGEALRLVDVGSGGGLPAQKTDKEPIAAAERAIEVLGGSRARVVPARSAVRRTGTLVIVEKIRPTPAPYPRRPGVARRKPL